MYLQADKRNMAKGYFIGSHVLRGNPVWKSSGNGRVSIEFVDSPIVKRGS